MNSVLAMANRRHFDFSHFSTNLVNSSRITQFHLKQIFITLAFVSCLFSIHCASFGHRSVNQQSWQRNSLPEYRVDSDAKEDEANLSSLLDRLSYQSGRQAAYDVDNRPPLAAQDAQNYYFVSPNAAAPKLDRQQLYQQLALARLLDANGRPSPLGTDSSSSSSLSALDYNSILNSDSSYNTEPEYNFKLLAELLQNNDNKKLILSDQQQQQQSLNDNLTPKDSFYLLADQSASKSSDDIGGQKRDNQAKDLYRVEDSNTSGTDEPLGEQTIVDNKLSSSSASPLQQPDDKSQVKDEHKKFTTLLEDEDTVNSTSALETTKKADDNNDDKSKSTTVAESNKRSTTVSYGSVVGGESEQQNQQGVLASIFSTIASYLPSWSQLNILNSFSSGGTTDKSDESKILTSSTPLANGETTKQSVSKPTNSVTDADSTNDVDVSAPVGKNEDNQTTTTSAATIATTMRQDNDDKVSKNRIQQELLSKTEVPEGSFLDSELDSAKISATKSNNDNTLIESDSSIDESKQSEAGNSNEVEFKRIPTQGGDAGSDQRFSLLRQSSLIMPFNSNDQLLVRATSPDDNSVSGGSLLGKYVYVPEQHFHLNAASTKSSDDDDQQVFSPTMSHRSYARRLHPGDDVYGSYTGLRPIYTTHGDHETLGLVANKTNDLYFLVMVAAFCVMAMAVVLAAGLFAYRVQQNRKSTTETDYPTYGVVGPNNMSGKCGAAAFVGGYFGAMGPGSSSSGSKAGSNKHLPDIFSGSDSGVATSKQSSKRASNDQTNMGGNNNNNRSDFSANQNAARMYHYQHQKQQMIISDRTSTGRHTSASDLDSEDENDDGSYTVYECPGLASAHEMEIKNPLFNDDQTP